jgi:hypothetical protein
MTQMKAYIFPSSSRIVILLTFLLISPGILAQSSRTLYWMQGIPQSTFLNPAIQPLADVYVGLPAISSFYTGFSNSGFSIEDVLKKDFNSRLYIDDSGLLQQLKDKNSLIADVSNTFFSFGFRTKRGSYYTLSVNERVEGNLGYPGDILRMVIEGNDPTKDNSDLMFSGLGLDASHYREYGISYSRNLSEKLTFGIKAKLLQGLGNIDFSRSNLNLYTDPDNFNLLLAADLMANTSIPIRLAPLIKDDESDYQEEEFDPISYLTNFGNTGFAADAGFLYNMTERFSLALSVRDLGYINWNTNIENLALSGEALFQGFKFADLNQDEDDERGLMGRVLDSLIDLFEFQETANAYRLMMSPKFYASAAFKLSSRQKLAVLARGDLHKGTLSPSFTASYNVQPLRRLGFSLSWSMIHGNYQNFGFGLHTNFFPLQFYILSDNIFAAMQPHTLQNFNLQFGLNIVAFSNKRKAQAEPSVRW